MDSLRVPWCILILYIAHVPVRLCADLFNCDFQGDYCGMQQQTNDQFNWDWTISGSSKPDTGPSRGHKTGGFLYTDNTYFDDTAKVNTGPLGHNGPICLQFYYYMYGSDIPENGLRMYVKNDAEGGYELYQWSASYDQGAAWHLYRETVYGITQDMMVGWLGRSGGYNSQVALDDIRISDEACGDMATALPFYCDFETGNICDMKYSPAGVYNWTRHTGSTDTINTGPSSAQAGEYYMFIESSSPRQQGDFARLETMGFETTGPVCVEFASHMFGASVGYLIVMSSNKTDPWLTLTGNKGNQWIQRQVDMDLIEGEKVVFKGIRGASYHGDIAIDSIVIREGVCSSDVYACDFDDEENDFCNMIQSTDDQFDWTWVSFGTPNTDTGPSWGHTEPGYLFTDSSFHPNDYTAKISTPSLGHNGDICVEFRYYLYGADIPSDALRLYTVDNSDGGREELVWSKSGEQGARWIKHKHTLRGFNRYMAIAWVAKVGGLYSQVAMDTLRIDKQECSEPAENLPYLCDFEDADLCGMLQSEDDTFDWTQTTEASSTSNTGPSGARSGTAYVFIETSDPRRQGDQAMLSTPVINSNGTVCVKFYAHMYGSSVGYLTLESSNHTDPWLTLFGDHGNQWVWHQVTVDLVDDERIFFRGLCGDGFHGDIGLDSVAVIDGACSDTLFQCEFDEGEHDLCSLVQGEQDAFDWSWNSQGTPVADTGPDAAYTGPGYLYTDTRDPRRSGDMARLTTGGLGHHGTVCLEFYYSMYGDDMSYEEALVVYLCHTPACEDPQYVWSKGGDQGQEWHHFRQTVTGFSPATSIGWTGKIEGYRSQIAIDSILIAKEECSDQPVSLPYVCDFEDTIIGGMVHGTGSDFNWTRLGGSTPTSNTGPGSAQSGEYYMYIESSAPRQPGDTARLRTPKLSATGPVCVQFYAHAYGESIGNLVVKVANSTTPAPVFTGSIGNEWVQYSVNFEIENKDRIGFRGACGDGYHGDIAIDNVEIVAGTCTSSSQLFNCTFDESEDDMCDLVQQDDDQFDWTWMSYASPSDITGPTDGYTSPGYMYTDSTIPRVPGDLAKINTGTLKHNGAVCVEFWYYMYGPNFGENALQMYTFTASGGDVTTRWMKGGNQGPEWIRYKDTVRGVERNTRIGWVSRVDSLFSQIAIDSIQITKNECDEVGTALPYHCDFEASSVCEMTQSEADDFHWTRATGSTSTSNTGPTSAQHGSYYMFIESSTPRVHNEYALFQTPVIDDVGSACVTFYAHMFGESVGSLIVISTNHTNTAWLTVTGNQGDQWVQKQVSVNLLGREKMIFKGVVGDGFLGDIAIDNVAISAGACSSDLFSCFFDDGENDLCNLVQQTTDDFDWTWISLNTPESGTGPNGAHSGMGYIYTQSSAHSTGHVASVHTGDLGYSGAVCIEFGYYMYGEDISVNALQMGLYNTATGFNQIVWTLSGNQGQQWIQHRQTIKGLGPNMGIAWNGRVGGIKSQVAIDSIKIVKGECQVLARQLPYECGFEEAGLCGMSQYNADDFDWSRGEGYTPTSNTGPAAALSGGYYMFIETSVPRLSGDAAILQTPALDWSGPACVEFYAHLYGQSIDKLVIMTSNRTDMWFMAAGTQGDHWSRYRVDVTLNTAERVWFKGVCGNGYFGDIAIDHVTIKGGECPTSVSLFDCNFDGGENDICSMIQPTNDNFDWTWVALGTPHEDTGPGSSHTSPGFVFTTSRYPRMPGDVARLITGPLNYYGSVCVEFWYYMYGADIHNDALQLYLQDAAGSENDVVVWSRSGDQGAEWIHFRQTVSGVNQDISIGWKGRVGGPNSQLAIDSITIVEGECYENLTTVGPTEGSTEAPTTTEPTTEGPPPTTPVPDPIVNLPYYCGFETSSICEMEHLGVATFNWTRNSGKTATLNTGPDYPHGQSYYMYIETSDPRVQADYATLKSPLINATGGVCVQFYYHMYGADVGTLYLMSTKRTAPLATLIGDKGNQWNHFQVDVGLVADERFIIKGICGKGYLGDIAIDDLSITRGLCTDTLFECEFDGGENDFCDMVQQVNDMFDWTWVSAATPGELTGPPHGHTAPGYIFADSGSPNEVGHRSKISTPVLKQNGLVCLEFWYYMYGADIPDDALQVFLRNPAEQGSEATAWSSGGDRGQQWLLFRQTLSVTQDISIGWRARIGGFLSHVAIDSIRIEHNECVVATTEEMPTTSNMYNDTAGVTQSGLTTIRDMTGGKSTLPFVCSFEEETCNMILPPSNTYNWILTNEGTPSRSIGPDMASDGRYYLYLESDPPMMETQYSAIVSPTQTHYGPVCLQFDFYLYGSQDSFIKVLSHSRGADNPLFSRYGGHEEGWESAKVQADILNFDNFTWIGWLNSGSRGCVAVDNLRASPGHCMVSNTPGTTDATTVSSSDPAWPLPFLCEFELDLCNMTQPGELQGMDQFDWTMQTGSTRSASTGPSRAQAGAWYVYIEANRPRKSGDTAILETPALAHSGKACLALFVSMFGRDIDSLMVLTSTRGAANPWLVLEGPLVNGWVRQVVDINLARDKIQFKAVRGLGDLGDIGVDSINITAGGCAENGVTTTTTTAATTTRKKNTGVEGSLPFTCDFENEAVCNMYQPGPQDGEDKLDWKRYSGKTSGQDTGPDRAQSGSWYMYTETKQSRAAGDDAILETPIIRHFGTACMKVYVYMKGDDVRTLMVMTSTRGIFEPWEVLVGSQQSVWFQAHINIILEYDKVQIRAVRGQGEEGEIAIDNLQITEGRCGGGTTRNQNSGSTTPRVNPTNNPDNSSFNNTLPPRSGPSLPEEESHTLKILLGVFGAIIGVLILVAIGGFVYYKCCRKEYKNVDATPDDISDPALAEDNHGGPEPGMHGGVAPQIAAATEPTVHGGVYSGGTAVNGRRGSEAGISDNKERPNGRRGSEAGISDNKERPIGRRGGRKPSLASASGRYNIYQDIPPPLPSNEPTPVEGTGYGRPK